MRDTCQTADPEHVTHHVPALAPAQQAHDALWRPSAVAAWSLVFTPAFGSWLLMHNWRILGDARAAAGARRWLRASLAMLALQLLAGAINRRLNGDSSLFHWLALAWLALWLLGAAWPQWAAVRRRYGRRYPRRGWNGALGLAVACGAACLAAGFLLTAFLLSFT
ncbi:hypothetical protein [Massilia sp.]|uniref:hypothetical protein n=1 Tax=Massilia sp. TaxID=1882437 RepID=UPI0028B23594|nr:hypothetical protein [Massilia sp.]